MNTEINVTNEIINVDTTTSVIDVNVTNEIIVIEATQGAYPLPATVYSVFGRTGDVLASFGDYSTSLVTEGTNLYYTDARARGSLSAGTGIGYSSLTGIISNTAPDQTVTLTSGSGIGITGTYPSFTIASTITQYTDALARAAISLTTIGTSGAATYSPLTGVLNIPQYAPDLSGYVPTSRTLTINGTTYDLSANRSWTIDSMVYPSAGIAVSTGTAWGTSLVDNSSNWNTAYNRSIVSASVTGTTTKTLTLNEQDGSTITASWTDINTDAVTSVFGRTGAVVATEGDYTLTQLGDVTITTPSSGQVLKYNGTTWVNGNDTDTGLTSVGVSMPVAFNVANSPLIANGTIAVTAAGTSNQYIRGDGQLATFPTTGGGGSLVYYYLNGSVNASVATYKQMSNTAVIGLGTDFNLIGNGLIAQFLTDTGNPNRLIIPSGAWNIEMYFSVSSVGGNQKFYVELLKYDGTTFTSITSGATNPEEITGGISTDLYITSIAVPETTLLVTDRLAMRVYVVDNSGGRTVTLHTEDNNLCQIITTFSTGVTSLDGLTANTQYLAVGTAGSDFNISSLVDTHTFNLPTASATTRGALSSTDWSTFNSKQNSITLTTTGTSGAATLIGSTLNIPQYNGGGGSISLAVIGSTPNANAATLTGSVLNLEPASASFGGVVTTGTQTFAGAKTFSSSVYIGGLITGRSEALQVKASDATISLQATNNANYAGIAMFDASANIVASFQYGNASAAFFANSFFFGPRTSTGVLQMISGASTAVRLTLNANGDFGINTTTFGASKFQINGNAAIGYSASTAAPTNGLAVAGQSTFASLATFGSTSLSGRTITATNNDVSLAPLYLQNNGSTTYITTLDMIAPNLTIGQSNAFTLGRTASTNNTVGFNFYYAGAGSTSNAATFTFYGGSPLLWLSAGGNLALGTSTFGASKFQVNGSAAIGYSASTAAPTNGLQVAGDIQVAGTGSTTTTPRIVGVNGYTTNNAARFQFGDSLNCIQNSYGGLMQLVSYHGMQIYGGRGGIVTNFIAGGGAPSTDPSLNVIGTETTRPTLVVTATASQSANIQQWRNSSNAVLASMSNAGSITAVSFIKTGGLSTQYLMADGSVTTGGGGGSITLSAIGSTPNANAATLTGSALNLEPASASFGGVVTTGVQTFAGAKTFSSSITALSIVKSGGTSAQYLMADGSVTTGTGGTVSLTIGQAVVSGTENSILFVGPGNLLAQDNANFSWNDTTNKLNIGGDALVTGVLSQTIVTNRQIASYTLVLTDRSKLVETNVATANNLTVPLNSSVAFPIGTEINIVQYGAGQTTVVATSGVTIRSTNNWVKLNARYGAATLIKIDTDEWYLFGNLNA